jgi:hypothetical protein
MIEDHSRIGRARRRARSAKVALGALTAVVFGVAFIGAKSHAPGHAKRKATPLGAPSSFKRAIGSNSLQSGQIAPAPPAQPPAVSSSTS